MTHILLFSACKVKIWSELCVDVTRWLGWLFLFDSLHCDGFRHQNKAAFGLSDGKKFGRTSHVNHVMLVVFNVQIRIFMALKFTNMICCRLVLVWVGFKIKCGLLHYNITYNTTLFSDLFTCCQPSACSQKQDSESLTPCHLFVTSTLTS